MQKKNVLICDDEEGIRESLRLILENKHHLVFACDGNECLSYLKEKSDVDVVLLDIKMPQIDGLNILKQIKKFTPKAKVVIVSGYNSVETAAEASRLGADDYITKPFEKQSILQAISNLTQ